MLLLEYLFSYILGYSNDYFDTYKKVLKFVPTVKQNITNQVISLDDVLLCKISNFVYTCNRSKFIVSLSGGVDSMVLATIIKYLGNEVVAVHINYNNRPETKQEEEFLEKWCFYNGIKLYIKRINDVKRALTKRSDYEKITRKIRFDFYKEIMRNENIDQILLGHHKDDIVENIFANVCRGRNILDLAVIRPTCVIEGVNIARPMLDFYKDDIYLFASVFQVPYFKDTTPEWSVRGKYRNNIFPLLEDTFTNNIKDNLIGLSNQSDQWNELIQKKITGPFMKNIKFCDSSNICEFNVENYNDYPMAFWTTIFSNIFFHYGKTSPSRRAIQTFMNSIKTKNVCYISLSNLCKCYNKNYNIKINFT